MVSETEYLSTPAVDPFVFVNSCEETLFGLTTVLSHSTPTERDLRSPEVCDRCSIPDFA